MRDRLIIINKSHQKLSPLLVLAFENLYGPNKNAFLLRFRFWKGCFNFPMNITLRLLWLYTYVLYVILCCRINFHPNWMKKVKTFWMARKYRYDSKLNFFQTKISLTSKIFQSSSHNRNKFELCKNAILNKIQNNVASLKKYVLRLKIPNLYIAAFFSHIQLCLPLYWKINFLLFTSRSKHMQNDNVDIYSIPNPSLMLYGLCLLLF